MILNIIDTAISEQLNIEVSEYREKAELMLEKYPIRGEIIISKLVESAIIGRTNKRACRMFKVLSNSA